MKIVASKTISRYIVFCFTYGDGVGDINVREPVEYHKTHGKYATLTATFPGRFGALEIVSGQVWSFHEKPKGDGGMINGGFFVLNSEIFEHIEGMSRFGSASPH